MVAPALCPVLYRAMHLSGRLFLPLVFLAIVGLLTALYLGGGEAFLRPFADAYLIYYDLPPFGDAYGITSAMVCERQGIETYLANPCHYKPDLWFVYPPIWKLFALLPVATSWTAPLAFLFMAAFAAALYFVPLAESRMGRVLAVLTLVSPATLMAVNYGNNDLLVFALIVAAIVALGLGSRRGGLGYALLLLAGLLKYFPLAALAWAGGARPRVLAAVVGATVLVLGLYVILAGEQLPLSFASFFTVSAGSYVFGIKSIGIAAMEMGLVGPGGALVIRLCITLLLVVIGWRLATRYLAADVRAAMEGGKWCFLIVGSMVLLGAYIGNQNLVYRMIFILLVLPGLDALRKVPGERFGLAAVIGVFSMFVFPLRVHLQSLFAPGSGGEFVATLGTILLREALWFAFAATLMGLVLAFLRSGPVWQELTARWQPRPAT